MIFRRWLASGMAVPNCSFVFSSTATECPPMSPTFVWRRLHFEDYGSSLASAYSHFVGTGDERGILFAHCVILTAAVDGDFARPDEQQLLSILADPGSELAAGFEFVPGHGTARTGGAGMREEAAH